MKLTNESMLLIPLQKYDMIVTSWLLICYEFVKFAFAEAIRTEQLIKNNGSYRKIEPTVHLFLLFLSWEANFPCVS